MYISVCLFCLTITFLLSFLLIAFLRKLVSGLFCTVFTVKYMRAALAAVSRGLNTHARRVLAFNLTVRSVLSLAA